MMESRQVKFVELVKQGPRDKEVFVNPRLVRFVEAYDSSNSILVFSETHVLTVEGPVRWVAGELGFIPE